jgi:hypothetical protein
MGFIGFTLKVASRGRLKIRNNRKISEVTDVKKRRYLLKGL